MVCLLYTSYERQGVELLPTVHEGATVRAMEKKGIRTEKGEFNRWIRATNAVIRDIKKKIALLFDWIAEEESIHMFMLQSVCIRMRLENLTKIRSST